MFGKAAGNQLSVLMSVLAAQSARSKTTTDEKGFYTVTTRHRPTQMLYLTVEKEGFTKHTENFLGFAAPNGDKNVELLKIILPTR
ncbi:MAG: hypothetical protein M3Q33_10625 [Acidobacteriota bacterium]|nr:hypothetical protein [Acidobacteriota bacterium]